MAQVALKSTAVTNANSTPRVQNNTGLENGRLVRAVNGLVTITSGNTQAATLADGASTYRVGKVRSSDFIHSWRVASPDIGTTTVVDLGLYDVLAHTNGGAVVSQTFFNTSLSLKDGAIDTTTGVAIASVEKHIWEMLSLTSDPNKEYDVVLTLTGAADGTGTLGVQVNVVR